MRNLGFFRFFAVSIFIHLAIFFLIAFLILKVPAIKGINLGNSYKVTEVSLLQNSSNDFVKKTINPNTVKKSRKFKNINSASSAQKIIKVDDLSKFEKLTKNSSKDSEIVSDSLSIGNKINLEHTDSTLNDEVSVKSFSADSTISEKLFRTAQPDYDRNPKPNYPLIARRRGYEGQVVVDVFVLRDGKVGDLRLSHTSGHEVLDESAIKAIKDWIFIPQKNNGEPVSSWVKIPIKFKLTDI